MSIGRPQARIHDPAPYGCQAKPPPVSAAAVHDSRPVVDQATGILMARHGCSADDARQMLSVSSQHDNRRLRDLARAIVDDGWAVED